MENARPPYVLDIMTGNSERDDDRSAAIDQRGLTRVSQKPHPIYYSPE